MSDAGDYEISVCWSAEDGAFVAEVSDLPGCVADGATLIEAMAAAREAARLWIETAIAEGREVPLPRVR